MNWGRRPFSARPIHQRERCESDDREGPSDLRRVTSASMQRKRMGGKNGHQDGAHSLSNSKRSSAKPDRYLQRGQQAALAMTLNQPTENGKGGHRQCIQHRGFRRPDRQAAYSASKGRWWEDPPMAGPFRLGIRVMTIAPGFQYPSCLLRRITSKPERIRSFPKRIGNPRSLPAGEPYHLEPYLTGSHPADGALRMARMILWDADERGFQDG